MFVRIASIIVLLGAAVCLSGAQQRDAEIKLRLAQSYERVGDWENASKLYEELYARDSTNIVFSEALRRGYLALKRYDGAERVVQQQLRRRPNDVGLLAQLGVVYARAGSDSKAIEAWNRATVVDRKNANNYRVVANAATESRMFDQAIAIYTRGRSECGDPALFAPELAYLHSMMMNFKDATKEYLALVQQNASQLSFVQSRMASYTLRTDGLSIATSVVEEATKSDPSNVNFFYLLAWLFMEGKRYDKAYDVYVAIDKQTNANGREIYTFAERALKDKSFAAASKAFKAVISSYPRFDRLPLAQFGYARTLEEMLAAEDTVRLEQEAAPFMLPTAEPSIAETRTRYATAIEAFNKVVQNYPKSEVAIRALLRIASIQADRFFDLDGAAATLRTVQREYASFPMLVPEATLRLGDVLLAKGDLEGATGQFAAVQRNGAAQPPLRELAQFRLAEIEYFQGKHEDAAKRLTELIKNPSADIANDALTLSVFIQDNLKRSPAALTDFAKASFLVRQRKLSEAVGVLQDMLTKYPSLTILDETLLLLGDALASMKRHKEAIEIYQRVATEHSQSILLDKAQLRIGLVCQGGLKDSARAIAAYQTLLEKYPNSIYTNEARRRIRELRGDKL
jgi:TolA-binding protein